MPPRLIVDLYALAVGLVVGSYLNVVIHRLPRGLSTVRPRSACPWCGGAIRARDNLPVVSFLLLRGRCRRCGAPIGWRYPLLEAGTGLLFVACVERFGATPTAAAGALFVTLLLALAGIDLEHYLLPDKITLPGVVAGLALQPWLPATTFVDALVGTLAGAGTLILVINVWYWLFEREGMGLGDVNMLAMIGAFLGWKGALLSLFLAALLGSVTGLVLVLFRRLGLRSPLPFGVFLALAAAIALFVGAWPIDLLLAGP